jgi:hypothetical protein
MACALWKLFSNLIISFRDRLAVFRKNKSRWTLLNFEPTRGYGFNRMFSASCGVSDAFVFV